MKRHVYRERDYAFAQMILTLRTAIGLSQAGLAERLGASRRAVAEWEGGLSYPKTERLKQLIALGVQQQAFAAGREEEEIRALWKAAHQKVWLDEAWLHDLLASPRPVQLSQRAGTPAAHNGAEPAASSRVDLVEALDVSHFAGREVEVAELSAVDRAGALPPGDAAGHGRHRQEYAGLLPGEPPGSSLRGGALALAARRPLVRGAGRRLHHLLLRDAARRIPHLAGAAHHAARGALAGEPLPAGARQPGDAAGERGPRGQLPAGLRGLRAADRAPGRVGPPELCAADLPREAQGDRTAGRHSLPGALAAPGGGGRTDRPCPAQRQGTRRYTCRLAAPRGRLRGQSAGPQDRGAGDLRPLRWRSRPLSCKKGN